MPFSLVVLATITNRIITVVLFFCLYIPSIYAQSQENGEYLFKHHCAVCHGTQGQGGVGVPLSALEFINTVDDRYLRTTIQQGRVGRVMPAFYNLKANEINAIIQFMRSWSGKASKNYSEDLIKGDLAKGKKLYESFCSSCHGNNGEGGHGTGVTLSRPRNLPVLPPALYNPGFLAAAKDQVIKAIIINGHKGSAIPQTKDKPLSGTEIDYIVSYIRSFENQSKPNYSINKDVLPTIVRESSYDLQTTVKHIKEAVVRENLRLIRVQNLDYGFIEPELENAKQVVVYSCGFDFLYQALKVDPRIGLFLPCRVTVVEQDNKVLVMAVNPRKMSELFNNHELSAICDDMYNKYVDLIEGALL